MKILLQVEVEVKEEHGAPDNSLPSGEAVAAYVLMGLREAVRPEYEINWIPTRVSVVEG